MSNYTEALAAFAEGKTQIEVAAAFGCTQAAVSRYLAGRLPTREVAEEIDRATGGSVPLSLWQTIAAARLGIAA